MHLLSKMYFHIGGNTLVTSIISIQVIAITVEDEEDIAKFKDYQPSASDAGAAGAKGSSAPPPPKKEAVDKPAHEPEPKVSKPSAPAPSGDRIFASPLARKLAEEKNVSKYHG